MDYALVFKIALIIAITMITTGIVILIFVYDFMRQFKCDIKSHLINMENEFKMHCKHYHK